MKILPLLGLVGSLGLSRLTVSAQNLLAPSAQLFNQHYFRPRNVFQKLTWLDKAGKVQATAVLNLITRVDSVQHRLTFLQLRNDGKRDSSVAELPTLRPVYVASLGRGQKFIYDYRDGQAVKVIIELKGKTPVNEIFAMPNPYFDGFLSEYLLGALPLQPGYTAQFEIYRGDTKKNGVTSIKNVSIDFIATASGQLLRTHCVLLESNGNEARYWLDAATGEILKMVVALPTGGFFIKTKV